MRRLVGFGLLIALTVCRAHEDPAPEALPAGWRSTHISAADCPEIARSSRAELVAMLDARAFSDLEARLEAHRRAARANPLCESNLFWAYDDVTDSLPPLDAWVDASRRSHAAWGARGMALASAGYQARGDKFAAQTPPENIERMYALHERALTDADRAIALDPSDPIAYATKIKVFQATHRVVEARRAAAALFEHDPASYGIRRRLVEMVAPNWGGSLEQVEQEAEAAQKFADRDPRLRVLLGYADAYRGEAAWRANDWPEVVAHYSRALQHGDVGITWTLARANAYEQLGEPEKARADYERAHAVFPEDPEAATRVAWSHFTAGAGEAIEEVSEVLRREPGYAYGYAMRGSMYGRTQRPHEAAEDFLRAAELGYPTAGMAADLARRMAHDLDQAADAERLLREVIQSQPQAAAPHFALADALNILGGRVEEEQASLQRFLALADPADPNLRKAIEEARRHLP